MKSGSQASTIGYSNPLRYRGYIYDEGINLYYLQSRYYNPTIGRFINADGLVATGQGLLGNNMFAYCNNNPSNLIDPTGTCGYIYSIYFWSDCGKITCEQSDAYIDFNNLGSNLTYFACEVIYAFTNSFEGNCGTGMGFGASIGFTVAGIPVEASAVNRTASMLTLSNGEIDIKSVTGYCIGMSIAEYIGKNFEKGVSHSIAGDNCHCKWWDTAYCRMATCKANEEYSNTSTAIGISGSAYFIIGGEFSIGFNIYSFCNNVETAWDRVF